MRKVSEPLFLEPVLSGVKRTKYRALSLIWLVSVGYLWLWWLTPAHVLSLWAFLLVTAPMLWIYLTQAYFVRVFLASRRSVAPDPVPGQARVAMIVTKTPSEPLALLTRTLEAMLAQDYPHDTWLADEDPQPATIAWCAARGVRISSRKGVAAYHQPVWPRRTRCKEGNLAYFYDHWGYDDYDLVVQLDADHVPQPGYLREMLRPFADPGVGYVSAPSICSANAKESWAARTRLFAEAAFHGIFQAGYAGMLAPMCIGSHYAVRTAALRDIGGLGPELAEDHSTSMRMNAGGWRGVHAIDAIAYGDGPASLPDMVTQEFQWSRSLLTLLLSHSGQSLPHLPWRLKFLFVLCQLWYPIFAVNMVIMYLVPLLALCLDMRFADVTFPAFLGHMLPSAIIMLVFAYEMKRDGFFRPFDAKVISWERALFVCLQWPWVLWGCLMALRDKITGKFVDFRITPKGDAVQTRLPKKIVALYAALALGCIIPVMVIGTLHEARGFYLLLLANAVLYGTNVIVIVFHHFRENRIDWRTQRGDLLLQAGTMATIIALFAVSLDLRAVQSLHALSAGMEPFHLTRVEFVVAGAGQGGPGQMDFRFAPGWN
ncbi:glycosyltransferase family 2 protein [Phaeovulum sp. W22_SRMD_FR3]|uniref:glycosyltransferase family 2 protein n=1 Tax=Phaeovulum sp. W22_SRMD_FR3 TaxID=3240274 RepID=UPI003F9511BD